MELKTRRIIAFAFIVAFLITAPILILYASGYRYNLKKNQLKKTGALFIKTEPKSAAIYIDNKMQTEKTPAQITHIFPNSHEIAIKKTGYYTWEKKLEIHPQTTTFAENIVLFKKNEPIAIKTEKNALNLYKTNDCLMTSLKRENETIHFACIEKNNLDPISAYPAETEILDQSPSKNKFLIVNKNGFSIGSTDNSYKQKIIFDEKLKPKSINWDFKNEHFIYYNTNSSIWQINLLGKNPVHTKIHDFKDKKIKDFKTAGDKLYYITGEKDGHFLHLANLQNPNESIKSIKLPSSNFLIDSLINEYLVLIDNKKSNIYILTEGLNSTKVKKEGCEKYSYFEEKNLLAIYNDYEIFVFDLKQKTPQSNLIIRYSTEINQVEWFDENYLLAIHDQKIKIIELDQRENHNIWELKTKSEPVSQMRLDEKKENIYYIGEDQTGKKKIRILNIQ